MEPTTIARSCPSCSAAMDLPPEVVSATCIYCDSPLVDDERVAGRIDRVAPFRVPRTAAEEKLRLALGRRFFAPAAIRRGTVARDRLRPLLVPFWAYRGTVRSRYRAGIGVDWTREVRERDAQGRVRVRQVRETEWFTLEGSAVRAFDGQLVSASRGLPEDASNALEPFDLERTVPFDMQLMASSEAELPTVERAAAEPVARAEIERAERDRIAGSLLPGDHNRLDSVAFDITLEEPEAVLLPVWISSYRHGDKVYRQMVNGQTGEVVTEAPVAGLRVALAVLGTLALIALIAALAALSR